MSKHAGQRRATKHRRIPVLGWTAAAIAIMLASVTTVAVFANPDDDSPDGKVDDADSSTVAKDHAGVKGRAACADATTVAVPMAYLDAWKQVTAEFAPDQSCLPISLTPVPSAAFALGKAPAVDAWIPEDASWIDRAAKSTWKGTSASTSAPVARTPIVVATSAQLSQAVGGIQTLLTPKSLGPLVLTSKTFADFGDDSAGSLRIALPDPSGSATGGLGFAALVQAATGTALAGAPSYVNPSAADLTTIKTEHRVVAVADDEAAALKELDPTSPAKANMSVTTEHAALAQMESSGEDDLAVGYLGADLAMSVVAIDKTARPVVEELAAYVASPEGATALTTAGLRPATGAITPAAIGAVDPAKALDPGQTGSPDQLSRLGFLFAAMHQRISTLVLLDASGSMLQPLPGSDVSKIDLVRRATRDTLHVASPAARTGLMTFRSDATDRPVIRTPVRLAANGQRSNGELHSTMLRRAVDQLEVDGGTPLYNAVRDAYRLALASYDPDMINQIVLLSDGRNQDALGSISLTSLLQTLRDERDPQRPVRIIAIGYGRDADMSALNQIVAATLGRASWLQTVEGYSDAVQSALFSA